MDDNKKVTFSDREIEGIAKAIALADLAARSPKEKNPSIPMTKDESRRQNLMYGICIFCRSKRQRKKHVNQKFEALMNIKASDIYARTRLKVSRNSLILIKTKE